jgi:hypothetical protein
MSNPSKPVAGQGGVIISPTSAEQAPFIYFDGVSCFGQHQGTIQIELAASVPIPAAAGLRASVLQTAHIRCSPAAALSLRDALNKALALLVQERDQAPPIKTIN